MTRIAFFIVAIAVTVACLFSFKGDTKRITVTGPGLASPIQMTKDVEKFHVWAGPATSSKEPQSLIVDWSRGVAEKPKSLTLYRVALETTRSNPGTYVLYYAFDKSTGKGFVYLPGKGEPEYKDNTWLIFQGVEGKWFHAWDEWDQLAQPLISAAADKQ